MWKHSFELILLVVTVLIQQIKCCSDEPQCLYGSKYVLVQMEDTSTPVAWADAENYCINVYGTNLASIHSEADIADSTRACKRAKGIDKCWIGLSDQVTESEFVWSDGSTFDITNWASGEPTGDFVSTSEDCVYIAPEKNYGWNDFDCSGKFEIDKNIRVFSFLCNNPDYNPALECRCECDVCKIEGDPHITTFDQLLYHFMGNCSYLYVTPCFNNYQDLPIQISGSHVQCFANRNDRTCLKDVYVNLYNNNNEIAAQLKLGENYLAQWTGVGTLGWSGNVNYNVYYDWNNNPSRQVYILRTDHVLDVRFYWYDVTQHAIMDARIQVAKSFNPNGWGAFVDIWLAECYATSSVCGLCGLYNFNALDDFHYVDTNNNLVYISTEGVSNVKTMTLDAWDRTNEFGYHWLNLDINNNENEQCIVEGEPPSPTCADHVESYCAQFWQYYCDCNDDEWYYNTTWLQSCIWDTCSLCSQLDWNTITFQQAFTYGCFAFANITCINNCLPIDVQSIQPSYAPTNRPTKRPTPTPTYRPTNRPTRRPTYWPTFWPTNQPSRKPTSWPTNVPSAKPSNRPTPIPTPRPSNRPTLLPSPQPTPRPTLRPTPQPTPRPSNTPTLPPLEIPPQAETTTTAPTINYWWHWISKPTYKPTPKPTPRPTPRPTPKPTLPPLQTNTQAETTSESQNWWYWNNQASRNNNKKTGGH